MDRRMQEGPKLGYQKANVMSTTSTESGKEPFPTIGADPRDLTVRMRIDKNQCHVPEKFREPRDKAYQRNRLMKAEEMPHPIKVVARKRIGDRDVALVRFVSCVVYWVAIR